MTDSNTMTDGSTDGRHAVAGILDELGQLAAQVAGRPIRPDEGLMHSGLTSADLAVLLERAVTRWTVPIPVEVLFERGDLMGLAAYVAGVLGAAPHQPKLADAPWRTSANGGGARAADDRRALRRQIRQTAGHGRG